MDVGGHVLNKILLGASEGQKKFGDAHILGVLFNFGGTNPFVDHKLTVNRILKN